MYIKFLLSLQSFFVSDEKVSALENKIQKAEEASFDKILYWNLHEPFLYLGAGHFIWFPKNITFNFEEDFPKLLKFIKNSGYKLPDWIDDTLSCPWSSREEFEKDQKKQTELRQLLESTQHLQIKFLVSYNFEKLTEIIQSFELEKQGQIKDKIISLLADSRGLFALVDYCHFKGSGLNAREFFKGKGYGLKQLLDALPEENVSIETFIKTAKDLLKDRVSLSQGADDKWLINWMKRLDSYKNF